LLYKLFNLDIFATMSKLISSYLLQRTFRVSVEDEPSRPREMKAGVPQGPVLSPTLYIMYINNTPKPLEII
jgi:hypothetical protein